MSSPTESAEFKAGHAPAIKVGGMRVGASRPRQTSQGDDKEKNMTFEDAATIDNKTTNGKDGLFGSNNQKSQETDDEQQESRTVSNRVAGQIVSGTFVPIQKAFPPEATKHIHDKPGTYPKHDMHSHSKHDDQRFINQPRKQ